MRYSDDTGKLLMILGLFGIGVSLLIAAFLSFSSIPAEEQIEEPQTTIEHKEPKEIAEEIELTYEREPDIDKGYCPAREISVRYESDRWVPGEDVTLCVDSGINTIRSLLIEERVVGGWGIQAVVHHYRTPYYGGGLIARYVDMEVAPDNSSVMIDMSHVPQSVLKFWVTIRFEPRPEGMVVCQTRVEGVVLVHDHEEQVAWYRAADGQ